MTDLDDLDDWQSQTLLYLGLVAGVMWALFGYYLLRPTVMISAFFVGSTVAYNVLDESLKEDLDDRNWILFGTSGAVGLVGALLALNIVRLGIFVVGAAVGVMAAIGIYTLGLYHVWEEESRSTLYIAFGLLGILTGFLAVWKERPVIVVSTATSGSFLALWCVAGLVDDDAWPSTSALANGADTKTPEIYYYAAGIVGASLLAAMIQFKITAKDVDYKDKKEGYHRYDYRY